MKEKCFYEKLAKRRNKNMDNPTLYRHESQVLVQVLGEYFKNGDKLPKKFYIFKVLISSQELLLLLNDLGLNTAVKEVNSSLIDGNSYEVTINF